MEYVLMYLHYLAGSIRCAQSIVDKTLWWAQLFDYNIIVDISIYFF